MVRGEKKVVLVLVSNVNWHMIDNINLINSLVLSYTPCVTDTEMLECWERRHAFVTDGWMFCSVEKEMTSFSKCHFPSCAGIPGCRAAGRTVSAMNDTSTEGNCRMQIGAAKYTAGYVRADWDDDNLLPITEVICYSTAAS